MVYLFLVQLWYLPNHPEFLNNPKKVGGFGSSIGKLLHRVMAGYAS
jgi:hypothetical protein